MHADLASTKTFRASLSSSTNTNAFVSPRPTVAAMTPAIVPASVSMTNLGQETSDIMLLTNNQKRSQTWHQHPVWSRLMFLLFYATLFYSSGGPFFFLSLLQQTNVISSFVKTQCVKTTTSSPVEEIVEICEKPEFPNSYENFFWRVGFPLVSDPFAVFFPTFEEKHFEKLEQLGSSSTTQLLFVEQLQQTATATPPAEAATPRQPSNYEIDQSTDSYLFPEAAVVIAAKETAVREKEIAEGKDVKKHTPPIQYKSKEELEKEQQKNQPKVIHAVSDDDALFPKGGSSSSHGDDHTSAAASAPGAGVETSSQSNSIVDEDKNTKTYFHLMSLMGQNYFAFSLPYYVAAFLLENYIIYFVMTKELRHQPSLPGSIANLGQGVLMFLCSQMLFLNYKDPVYSFIWRHFRVTDNYVAMDDVSSYYAIETTGVSSSSGLPGVTKTLVPNPNLAQTNFQYNRWQHEYPALFQIFSFYLCLLLLDFFYYAWHRASHRISWLWAAHWVHHSTEEYNISVTFREPVWWSEMLIPLQFAIMRLPLAILGFPVVYMNTISLNDTLYMNMLHTELIDPLPTVELLLMTPSLHRVHHARNLRALAKNFGSLFSIWDRLCGTYEPEILPVVIDGKKKSENEVLTVKHPTQFVSEKVVAPIVSAESGCVVKEETTEESVMQDVEKSNKESLATSGSASQVVEDDPTAATGGLKKRIGQFLSWTGTTTNISGPQLQQPLVVQEQHDKKESLPKTPSQKPPPENTKTRSFFANRFTETLYLLTKFYRVRRDTRKCKDDREPLRYGVIPQFHSYDILQQNCTHWFYMFLEQPRFRGHGILAPFLHWTKPGSKCPPLSERSKVNGYKKYKADALHIGWSLYVIFEFLIFFASALGFVATNYVLSKNLAKTFYGACDTPLMDPISCTAGPLAEYFGPQQLTSAVLQVLAFLLGFWTMHNLGCILMGTENAPVLVGVEEGFVVKDSFANANNYSLLEETETVSASAMSYNNSKQLVSAKQMEKSMCMQAGTDVRLQQHQSSQGAAGGVSSTAVLLPTSASATWSGVSSVVAEEQHNQTNKLQQVPSSADSTTAASYASTYFPMLNAGATPNIMTSTSGFVQLQQQPSGGVRRNRSSNLAPTIENNSNLSSGAASVASREGGDNTRFEHLQHDTQHNNPALETSDLLLQSTATYNSMMNITGGPGAAPAISRQTTVNAEVNQQNFIYHDPKVVQLVESNKNVSCQQDELDRHKMNHKSSSQQENKIYSWQAHVLETNSQNLIFDPIPENNNFYNDLTNPVPFLTPGEKVYERNCVYKEMLRHWFIIFTALQFGDAMYNDASPESAATVSRMCTYVTLLYTVVHCILLPGLVFFSDTKIARESAARRRYRG
ncbi:unnamed protein product [Amoebophrya sp. A120]|nr:unnamed protein product [Amoebophrya sp. A120]|eukprot:GSA120T00019688001.1